MQRRGSHSFFLSPTARTHPTSSRRLHRRSTMSGTNEMQPLMNGKTDFALCILKDEITFKVPLVIGTLQWGTTWVDDKIINASGVITEEVARDIVDTITTKGVTLFDTAEGYGGGMSESRLGRLLGSNDENRGAVLMTKFLPAPWRCFHSDLERAVRASCRRMKVECIPIYLLHSPVHWRQIEYWVEACAICRKKGLIQACEFTGTRTLLLINLFVCLSTVHLYIRFPKFCPPPSLRFSPKRFDRGG